MSVAAMTAVWRYSSATTTTEIAVLLAMADYANDDGYCWPGRRAIALKSRASVPTVKRVLKLASQRGELEIVQRGGHRVPDPKESVGRTGFKPTTIYRVTLVDRLFAKPGSERPPLQAKGESPVAPPTGVTVNPVAQETGVTVIGEGGQGDPGRGSHRSAHIRNEPSLIRQRTAAAAAAADDDWPDETTADPIEAFRLAWNDLTTAPLLPVHALTPKRKRAIRLRLQERPLDVWRGIIRRINSSDFCRGGGEKGFRASFDWLVNTPDPGIKALEGVYDDTPAPAGASPADLATRDARTEGAIVRLDLPAHLGRVRLRLRAAIDATTDADMRQRLETLDRTLHEVASTPLDGSRRQRLTIAEQLERLDAELMCAAFLGATGETLAAIEREAEHELAPFRNRMGDDAWRTARDGARQRLLREYVHLPTLTWTDPRRGSSEDAA